MSINKCFRTQAAVAFGRLHRAKLRGLPYIRTMSITRTLSLMVGFRCYGDYIFRNGDSVAFVATQTNQGFWLIRMLKNVTSNFYFSEFKKRFPLFVFLKKFLSIFIISAIAIVFTSDALYNAIMTQFDLSYGLGINLWRDDFGLLLTIIAAIVGFLVGAFAYRKVSKERKIILHCEKEIKSYMG